MLYLFSHTDREYFNYQEFHVNHVCPDRIKGSFLLNIEKLLNNYCNILSMILKTKIC